MVAVDKGRSGSRVTPGKHLRAEIERSGMDQASVAVATDVSRQTINNIVNDRQSISRAMAVKLGRLMGRSSDYWLRSDFTEQAANLQRSAGGKDDEPGLAIAAAAPRSVGVGVLVDHQIVRAVRDQIIMIDRFSEDNVRAASIDLSLDDFILGADGEQIDISDEPFFLEAGQMVNVGTKEWIAFPYDYLGRVGAMTQLAKFGIILSHGFQVDPGYSGHLQFCLFNAGPRSFELRSGMPIVSLEIVHLSSAPTSLILSAPVNSPPIMPGDKKPMDRSDVESHFRGTDLGEACRRVIRDAIRTKVKTTAAHGAVVARIPELEIEIADDNGSDAADAAVSGALETLKLIRTHSGRTLEGADRYNDFFGALADTIFFDGNQARSAIGVLGRQVVKDSAIVFDLRRERASTIIHLPQKSSKIAFKALARQLREDPQELLLMLMGLLEYK